MASEHNQEQIRNAKIAAMGPELGELHYLLWHHLTWLHLKWQEFRQLFAVSESRIEVMNKTAPAFFWSLEQVLWQDIILHLARLCDPPGTGGQRNVTLRALPSLVHVPALLDELNKALDEVEAKTNFARDWRNRLYAHRELNHAKAPSIHPLAGASRASVEQALGAIRAAMNLLEGHYQKGEVAYEYAADAGGGAFSLLWYLDRGLGAEEHDDNDTRPWRSRFE